MGYAYIITGKVLYRSISEAKSMMGQTEKYYNFLFLKIPHV